MKHTIFLLATTIYTAVASFCIGQDTIKKGFQTTLVLGEGEQLLLEDADYFFSVADYQRAALKYIELDRKYPGTIEYKYRAAICILNNPADKKEAITMLEDARKIKPSLADIDFHLARAFHLNYRFDDAIKMYKAASANIATTESSKKEIPQLIANCETGKDLVARPVEVRIENLGAPVNSDGAEYAPVITADETMLIFTYKGKKSTGGMQNEFGENDPEGIYFEDIFMAMRSGDKWLEPKSVGPTINTKSHEASIGLSSNGQRLFIYVGSNGGDINVSTLQKTTFAAPVSFGENINSKYWEGSATLSADGTLLYFSSDRPGGQGGKDIYVSKLQPDMTWGVPKNVGTVINTLFDEDAPSIHVTGAYLFFSSKGHHSMGGYDIFYSKYVNNGWTAPRNIGYPINTPEDDIFYSVTANCEVGYFASARKNSLGQQDIYSIKPGLPGQKPKMLLVKGIVMQYGKGIESNLKVMNKTKNNELFGSFPSSNAGKFLISLPAGNTYQLDIELKGKVAHSETVNLVNVDSFTSIDVVINVPAGKTAVDTASVIQKQIAAKVPITASIEKPQTEQEAPVAQNNNHPSAQTEQPVISVTSTEKKQPEVQKTVSTQQPLQPKAETPVPPKPITTASADVAQGGGKKWPVPETEKNRKNPLVADVANINAGKALYMQHCKSCHGVKGLGDGPKAAELNTSCGDFTINEFRSQTDGEIFYKIREGREDMPSFKKKLPEPDDAWKMVLYIRSFAPAVTAAAQTQKPVTTEQKPKIVTDQQAELKAKQEAEEKAREQERMRAREKAKSDSIAQVKAKIAAETAAKAKAKADSIAQMKSMLAAEAAAKAKEAAEQKAREEELRKAREKAKADSLAQVKAVMTATAAAKAKEVAEQKAREQELRKAREKAKADSIVQAKAAMAAEKAANAKALAEEKEKTLELKKAREKAKADSIAQVKAAMAAAAAEKTKERAARQQLASAGQSVSVEGVYFKVQVGAYCCPGYFNSHKFSEFGSVDSVTVHRIIHYTVGKFTTLKEAILVRHNIIAGGITDAYVVAEENGERRELCEISGTYPELFGGIKITKGEPYGSCKKTH